MVKPLANRRNVKTPANGNTGVRFQDSTAKVAGVITSQQPLYQTGKKMSGGGCSGCSR